MFIVGVWRNTSFVDTMLCVSINLHSKKSFELEEKRELTKAFVLINVEIGEEAEVLKGLKKLKEELKISKSGNIEQAYAFYGVYDIIAIVTAKTMDELKEIVTWKIRRIEKVRSTLTMIVVEDKPMPHITS
jgi:DNA-binding Lrp family transcriptional regulator